MRSIIKNSKLNKNEIFIDGQTKNTEWLFVGGGSKP